MRAAGTPFHASSGQLLPAGGAGPASRPGHPPRTACLPRECPSTTGSLPLLGIQTGRAGSSLPPYTPVQASNQLSWLPKMCRLHRHAFAATRKTRILHPGMADSHTQPTNPPIHSPTQSPPHGPALKEGDPNPRCSDALIDLCMCPDQPAWPKEHEVLRHQPSKDLS